MAKNGQSITQDSERDSGVLDPKASGVFPPELDSSLNEGEIVPFSLDEFAALAGNIQHTDTSGEGQFSGDDLEFESFMFDPGDVASVPEPLAVLDLDNSAHAVDAQAHELEVTAAANAEPMQEVSEVVTTGQDPAEASESSSETLDAMYEGAFLPTLAHESVMTGEQGAVHAPVTGHDVPPPSYIGAFIADPSVPSAPSSAEAMQAALSNIEGLVGGHTDAPVQYPAAVAEWSDQMLAAIDDFTLVLLALRAGKRQKVGSQPSKVKGPGGTVNAPIANASAPAAEPVAEMMPASIETPDIIAGFDTSTTQVAEASPTSEIASDHEASLLTVESAGAMAQPEVVLAEISDADAVQADAMLAVQPVEEVSEAADKAEASLPAEQSAQNLIEESDFTLPPWLQQEEGAVAETASSPELSASVADHTPEWMGVPTEDEPHLQMPGTHAVEMTPEIVAETAPDMVAEMAPESVDLSGAAAHVETMQGDAIEPFALVSTEEAVQAAAEQETALASLESTEASALPGVAESELAGAELEFEPFMFDKGAKAGLPELPNIAQFMPAVEAMEAAVEPGVARSSAQAQASEPAPASYEAQVIEAAPASYETQAEVIAPDNEPSGPLPFWLVDVPVEAVMDVEPLAEIETPVAQAETTYDPMDAPAPLVMKANEAPVSEAPDIVQYAEPVSAELQMPQMEAVAEPVADVSAATAAPSITYAEQPQLQEEYVDEAEEDTDEEYDFAELPPIEPFDFSMVPTPEVDEELGFRTEELAGSIPASYEPMMTTANLDVLADLLGKDRNSGALDIRGMNLTRQGMSSIQPQASLADSSTAMPMAGAPPAAGPNPNTESLNTGFIMSGHTAEAGAGGQAYAADDMTVVDLGVTPFDITEFNLDAEESNTGYLNTGMLSRSQDDMPEKVFTGTLFTKPNLEQNPQWEAPEWMQKVDASPEAGDQTTQSVRQGIEAEDKNLPTGWMGTGVLPEGRVEEEIKQNAAETPMPTPPSPPAAVPGTEPGGLIKARVSPFNLSNLDPLDVEINTFSLGLGMSGTSSPDVTGNLGATGSLENASGTAVIDSLSGTGGLASSHDVGDPGTSGPLRQDPATTSADEGISRPPQEREQGRSVPEYLQPVREEAYDNSSWRAHMDSQHVTPQAPQMQQPVEQPLPRPEYAPPVEPAKNSAPYYPTRSPIEQAGYAAPQPEIAAPAVQSGPLSSNTTPVQPIPNTLVSPQASGPIIPEAATASGPLPVLEGFESLRNIVRQRPQDVGAHMALAVGYSQSGHYDHALYEFQRLLQQRHIPGPILQLITDRLDDIERETGYAARLHQLRGDILMKEGRFQEAIEEYNKIK